MVVIACRSAIFEIAPIGVGFCPEHGCDSGETKMKQAYLLAAALAAATTGAAAQTDAPAMSIPLPARPGLATPPEGWAYHPALALLGPAEIYHRRLATPGDTGPAVQMHADTVRNAGILTRDVAVPLTSGTRLSWRWMIDRLPSKVSEIAAERHDYFSIAVKFENGKDLTYMWSAAMPEGTHFVCPLPDWNKIEWHAVVRSGETDLGKWLAEERDLLADYNRVIGGKAPDRIVQVWLISASIIQQSEGRARFGDIMLTNPETPPLRVF
jgi:hypothetical protein